MRRVAPVAVLLALLLIILVPLLLFAGRPAPVGSSADGQVRVEQVDSSEYPQVSLFVSVLDDAGQPRGDLTQGDFALSEDGTPVDLIGFSGAGQGPISTALVLDRSGSMEDDNKIEGAREAAATFVEQMRPGDQAALIAFNSEVEVAQGFTLNQAELQDGIERLRPDGGTAVYDAVVAAVDLLREAGGRRVLLVLTDGQDCREPFDTCPDDAGSSHSLDEAIAYAQQAGQPVYLVGLGEDNGSGIEQEVLARIAEETAGRYYYAPRADELAALYASVAGGVQQEYRLTYLSPRPFYDGTRRDLQISVDGVSVAGGYTERHLINVVSNPLVGAALLLPLIGLLVLPSVRRRRGGSAAVAPPSTAAAPSGHALASASPNEAFAAPPSAVVLPPPVAAPSAVAAQQCASCSASLRPGARFCNRCGTVQPAAPAPLAERRSFCDMCGRPLMPGAKFCTSCGETVVKRS